MRPSTPIFFFSLVPSLPLSHAWTTTVSFRLFVECLESNPIGQSLVHPEIWNLQESYYWFMDEEPIQFNWQVFPSPAISPFRPSRPPLHLREYDPTYLSVGHCTDLAPGTCCRAIAGQGAVTDGQFSNLPQGAISAFWGPAVRRLGTTTNGCDETVLVSRYNAPQWAWRDPMYPPRIGGASYIECPTSGIARGWGAVLSGFCARLKRKRGEGSAVSEPPLAEGLTPRGGPAWVWPDLITVDGVNYTDDRRGDFLYYDGMHRLLNLTGLM